MCSPAIRLVLLLALASPALGCATVTCDQEAREIAAKQDEAAVATAKAKCEQRMADMRRTLQEKQREQDDERRRDDFRNRNDAQPR